jgi:glycosyltransferase involved in cell wall biosynthesis
MNIGVITYSLTQRSGARAPIRLAQFLQKRGHEISLYAYDLEVDTELRNRLQTQGIKIKLYPASKNSKVPFPLRGAMSIWKATQDFKKANHQVLSFHSTLPLLLAARFSGIKILATYYGAELSYYSIRKAAGLPLETDIISKIKNALMDRALILVQGLTFMIAHQVVTISRYLAAEAKDLFGREISVIYLGAEADLFSTKSNIGDRNYLLSVSRVVPYKGFDLIIKAFRQVTASLLDWKLIIVGSKANASYLRELQELSNEQVVFKSNIPDSELRDLYANCSLYVVGDLWVPWSLTPLEASFFGKPLLGLDHGAMKEIIVDGENGYLAKDPKQLGERMSILIKDKNLRNQFGKNAQERVRKFRWGTTAQEYEVKLKELLNL